MFTEIQGPVRCSSSNAIVAKNPLEILRSLVALPSVNPSSHDAVDPTFYEGRVTHWLMKFFESLDVPYECQEVFPGRHNVIARFESPTATRTILLDAHQDTVSVEGMTIPPFQPVLKHGRLYGRGACDVKGGMASMLAAFASLVEERPLGAANVLMACTVDEEYTATGAKKLAEQWGPQGIADTLCACGVPDVCLVAEPTELNVIVAHRGVIRWKLRTTGRACHSSRPEDGVNAIYKMGRILQCLQTYAHKLSKSGPQHHLCGGAALSVGRICGGTSVNIVPDECIIEIDRRIVPGEDSQQAMADLNQYLRQRLDVDFEMLSPWVDAEALSDAHNAVWADELLQYIHAVAGRHEKQGALYGTNASRYANVGIPSLIFGPGSIAQAHTADEWIDVEQLYLAREIYYRFCVGGLEAT